MKTLAPYLSQMNWIPMFGIMSLLLLYQSDLCSQNDKGQVTRWFLESAPHGPGQLESRDAAIRYDVKYVNATGGHIQAKLWPKARPECYAMADFKWSFSKDVSNVAQDERINVNFSLSAQRGAHDCSAMATAPLDPVMDFFVMSSKNLRTDLAGSMSEDGRLYLFAHVEPPGGNIRVSMNYKVREWLIVVSDRTSTGGDVDARDGGFGFGLGWRGLNYDVYYKYAAGNTGANTQPSTQADEPATSASTGESTPSSTADEPVTTSSAGDLPVPDLAGEWRGIQPSQNWDKTGYYITQNGREITLSYSGDGTSATGTVSGNVIRLTGGDWGRGTGTISQGGRRIDFDNGSYWIKLTTPGTIRSSANQDCRGDGIYMYAENRTGSAGKTIELPVFICNVNDLANMDVSLRWRDNVAQLVDVKKGAATKNISFQWNEVSKGYAKIAFAASRGFSGAGSVAIFVFRLVGPEGSETPVTGDVTTANSSDGANITIRTFTPGTITIATSSIAGDCDGDQQLTERDALAALQIAVEKRPFDKCYDVNQDGRVNSQDARIIIRRIVGLGT